MFWADAPKSLLEVILQRKNVQLTDIIFEEDLLTECRPNSGNDALIEFITGNLDELVDMVTDVIEYHYLRDALPFSNPFQDLDFPQDNAHLFKTGLFNGIMKRDDENKRSPLHVAYIAAEIMSTGEPLITDAIVDNPRVMNKLMTCLTFSQASRITERGHHRDHVLFTDIDRTALGSVHTILISKIITALHNHRSQSLLHHIKTNQSYFKQFLETLLDSIDYSGCVEIIGTFIDNTDPIVIRYKYCELLDEHDLIPKLVGIIQPGNDEEKQRNAGQLLCDINRFGNMVVKNHPHLPPDALMRTFESNVSSILKNMFTSHDDSSTDAITDGDITPATTSISVTTFTTGLRVIQSLIDHGDKKVCGDALADAIMPYLIQFVQLLKSPPVQDKVKFYQELIEPLGVTRLETVHFVATLIETNHPGIIDTLEQVGMMTQVIDLFFYYTWNNLLHTQVERIVYSLVENYRRDADSHFVANAQATVAEAAAAAAKAAETTAMESLENSSIEDPLTKRLDRINSVEDSISDAGVKADDTVVEPQALESCDKTENCDSTILPPPTPPSSPPAPEMPSRKLLLQLLRNSCLIERLVKDSHETHCRRDPYLANFGHIVLIANCLSINSDLDPIKEFIQEMAESNTELHAKWKTLIDVHVARYQATSTKLARHLQGNDTSHVNQRSPPENNNGPVTHQDREMEFIEYQTQDVASVMNPNITARPTNNSNSNAFQYFPPIECFATSKLRN